MKKLLLLLLMLTARVSYGQWILQDIPTTDVLTAVHFKNDDTGFTCGENRVYKTVNGGEDWVLSYEGSSFLRFEDVRVFNNDLVLAVGLDFDSGGSLIMRSDNGGSTWTRIQAPPFGIFLKSIVFLDAQTILLSGSYGGILKSTDGGLNWVGKSTGTGHNLQSIAFRDAQNGYAAGGQPGTALLLKTADTGETWTEVNLADTSNLQSVFFADNLTGYLVGWDGAILKTVNGGDTWQNQISVNMEGNLDVYFTDTQTGYIVGGSNFSAGSIQKTKNGGQLWEDISPDPVYGLVGVCFPSQHIGYAVGSSGTILKTTSGGTSASIEINTHPGVQCYPNPVGNTLYLQTDAGNLQSVKVYNQNGTLIRSSEVNSEYYTIDFTAMPAGNYYIAIVGEQEKVCRKIIKL